MRGVSKDFASKSREKDDLIYHLRKMLSERKDHIVKSTAKSDNQRLSMDKLAADNNDLFYQNKALSEDNELLTVELQAMKRENIQQASMAGYVKEARSQQF